MDNMCPTLDDEIIRSVKIDIEERHVKNVRSRLEAVGLAATRNLSDADDTSPHLIYTD